MADKKITELNNIGVFAEDDLLHMVDTSATSLSTKNKRITLKDVRNKWFTVLPWNIITADAPSVGHASRIINANTSSGAITVTLPDPSTYTGYLFYVSKTSNENTNKLTVTSASGNINGASSISTKSNLTGWIFSARTTANWQISAFAIGEPVTYTAAGNIENWDVNNLADASSAAFALTMPSPSTCKGREFYIKKTDSTTNAVTISANSAETFEGASELKLNNPYDYYKLISDGTNWIISSSYTNDVLSVTSATTLTRRNTKVLADSTSAPFTITMPDPTTCDGVEFLIKRTDGSANNITIGANGSETFEGSASLTLNAQWAYRKLVSDGTNWLITGS